MEICTLVCSGCCETRRRHSKRGAGARTGRNARPRHLCGLRTRTPSLAHAQARPPRAGARAVSRAGPWCASPRSLASPGAATRAAGRRGRGDKGRACRGGAREAEKVAAAWSPVACSRPPEVAVVNFTSQTFSIPVLESIGFPSVVTPPPEGCLAFRPRPEEARGFVGVRAGPREPEVTAGCARGREVLRGAWARREDRPWGCSLVRTRLPLSAYALRPPGGR